MEFNDYTDEALRTANSSLTPDQLLSMCGLGLSGEAGEVADMIKKHLYHGHSLNMEELKLELGDLLWYLTILAHACNYSLSEIGQANIKKLKKRFPDKFSYEASINRLE